MRMGWGTIFLYNYILCNLFSHLKTNWIVVIKWSDLLFFSCLWPFVVDIIRDHQFICNRHRQDCANANVIDNRAFAFPFAWPNFWLRCVVRRIFVPLCARRVRPSRESWKRPRPASTTRTGHWNADTWANHVDRRCRQKCKLLEKSRRLSKKAFYSISWFCYLLKRNYLTGNGTTNVSNSCH